MRSVQSLNALFDALSFAPAELIRLISEYAVLELSEFWDTHISPLLSRRDVSPKSVPAYNDKERIDSESWITACRLEVCRSHSTTAKTQWRSTKCSQVMERLAALPRRKLFSELSVKPANVNEFDRRPLPSHIQTVLNSLQNHMETAAADCALQLECEQNRDRRMGWVYRFVSAPVPALVNKLNPMNDSVVWFELRFGVSIGIDDSDDPDPSEYELFG